MKTIALLSSVWYLSLCGTAVGQLPDEPVEIGQQPQFFVDDWIVDNRFAVKYKTNAVVRVFHQPVKHEASPALKGHGGYFNVIWDEERQMFRAWWQEWVAPNDATGAASSYAIAYGESEDGISWHRPELGLFEWKGTKANNVVWRGPKNARASGPQILQTLPDDRKRGYRLVLVYRTGGAGRDLDGIRVIGSQDGIHWLPESDTRIKHIHSDTLNSIVFDDRHATFVMTCRAKDRYRTFKGEMIDTGASRRIARLTSQELWSEWEGEPQQLLIPDERDARTHHNFFYGMPMHYHAGIFWGFLWVFQMNDPIHTELVTSRDGVHWTRLPERLPLIPLGEDGAWDDRMSFAGPHWVERGDQWWFFYTGWDGPHQSRDRTSGLGLAVGRKEGLVSLRGPENGGGVVVTRQLVWPGGELMLNVDAGNGNAQVRISNAKREPIPGFDYDDCDSLAGVNAVRQVVRWGDQSMQQLAGEVIRIEVFLQGEDLFAFQAAGE